MRSNAGTDELGVTHSSVAQSVGEERASRRILLSAAALTLLVAAFGLLARWQIISSGLGKPAAANMFLRLYALHELPHLIVLGVFAAATVLLVVAGARSMPALAERLSPLGQARPIQVASIALAVLILAYLSHVFVLHQLLFSMDDFSAAFQARLFSRGEYSAVVPAPWRSIGPAVTPIFIGFEPSTGHWLSQYLPVYALLKAPFVMAGIEGILNPLLAFGSIVAIAAVARRLWPDEGTRPWVAVALLASAADVIVTSGTGYSMPAHLLLNLIWLLLYLRGDRRSWIGALVVGVLALGLHNPFPHALFVAPFLLRLLRERRWARVGSAAVAYGVGGAIFFAWLQFVYPVARGSDGGLFGLFGFPQGFTYWLHAVNVSLLFTWHAPVFGMLVLVTLVRLRKMEPVLMDLALGVAFTLGFFVFFPSTQGHGWGYRYAYQVLGGLSLLGAAAIPTVHAAIGEVRTRQWLGAALALTVLVQLPLRLWQTERFVRPFAAGAEYVRTRDAVAVLINGDSIWYGRDLIRNDPFLRGPVVVRTGGLGPGSAEAIERAFPGRVMRISDAELIRLGMTPWNRHQRMQRQ